MYISPLRFVRQAAVTRQTIAISKELCHFQATPSLTDDREISKAERIWSIRLLPSSGVSHFLGRMNFATKTEPLIIKKAATGRAGQTLSPS